jgi:hypothetical protein
MAKRRRQSAVRSRRRRRRNPSHTRPSLVVLYARRQGGKLLKYTGNKFAATGRAKLFQSMNAARMAAYLMMDRYPQVLRGYKLYARKAPPPWGLHS